MSSSKRPSRLFNHGPYTRNAIGNLNIPSSLVLPNADQVCNIAMHTGKTRTLDPYSIILSISGLSKENKASYGIWFGQNSSYNISSLLPEGVEQTGKCAELCAAINALNILIEGGAKDYNRFVILTESEYLVDGITRNIWEWTSTLPRFQDEEGYKLPNADIWHGLHEKVLDLEYNDIKVEFWLAESAFPEKAVPKKKEMLPGEVCYDYYASKASRPYEVKRIAELMNLDLPNKFTTGNKANVKYLLRRLVITGHDTEVNLELFFGDQWNDAEKGISELWRQARRSVLRSAMEKDAGKAKWFDSELSVFQLNVRAASENEKKAVKEHIASRNEKEKNKKYDGWAGKRKS